MNHFKKSKILPLLVAGFFLNGVICALTFLICGPSLDSALSCILISLLIPISYIDYKTMKIAPSLSAAVFALGLVRTFVDSSDYPKHIIGMLSVSFLIFLLMVLSGGRAIGGGDLKLMAGIGLFFGWQEAMLCFVLACTAGAVCGLVRMRLKGKGKIFALAPYISLGVIITVLFGERIIASYVGYI